MADIQAIRDAAWVGWWPAGVEEKPKEVDPMEAVRAMSKGNR